jgi:mannose-6-phosphate isomerase-like protein (cupin superfamily)
MIKKFVIDSMLIPGFKVAAPNERILKVVLSPDIGFPEDMTLLLSIISPGNSTGKHTHDSTEIMYVASGRGLSIIGNKEQEIRVDNILVAPKGILHEVRNTGDETLKLVCFYVPALKPSGSYKEAIEKAKQYYESLV